MPSLSIFGETLNPAMSRSITKAVTEDDASIGRRRAHVHDEHVGFGPVRDPHLRAVRDPAVVGALGAARHRPDHVGAGVCLAHRERPDVLAREQLRQPSRPLLDRSVGPQVVDAQVRVRRVRHANRGGCARDLLHHDEVLEEPEARPALGLGHGRTEHPQLTESRPEPPGERVVAVDLLRERARAPARRTCERSRGAPRSRSGRSSTYTLRRRATMWAAVWWHLMMRRRASASEPGSVHRGPADHAHRPHVGTASPPTTSAMRALVDGPAHAARRSARGRRRGRDRTTPRAAASSRPVNGSIGSSIAGPRSSSSRRSRRATCTTATLPAPGIVTGIGPIHGTPCVIVANDATVKGGTYFPITVKKHLRAAGDRPGEPACRASTSSTPGGAYLPLQAEVFPDRDHFGRIFFNQARMSAAGIPQIAAVMGSCTAGGAYVPAMSDETVIVRGTGTIFLGGPPLVKAATGEDVDPEELGGADVHARQSGVADHEAADDDHALRIVREIVGQPEPARHQGVGDRRSRRARRRPGRTSTARCPQDLALAYDVREVIARVVDGSVVPRVQARSTATRSCAGSRASTAIRSRSSRTTASCSPSPRLKGAHFVELACERGTPLVFLQNITGFMVGREYEAGGIAKDGAKLVTAVSCANVPKFTVIVGGSFGAGNYAMCGRAYGPRQLWMWPNARISVMGGVQAAKVLTTVGGDPGREQETIDRYEHEGSPYHSTARLWDDGVIDPLRHEEGARPRARRSVACAARADDVRGVPDVSDVQLTREGPIATLTLDRPDRRNALDPSLLARARRERRRVSRTTTRCASSCSPARAARSRPAPTSGGCARAASLSGRTRTAPTPARWRRRSTRSTDARRRSWPACTGPRSAAAPGSSRAPTSPWRSEGARVRLRRGAARPAPRLDRPVRAPDDRPGPGARALHERPRVRRRRGRVVRARAPRRGRGRLDATVDDVSRAFLTCGPEAVAANKRLVRDATVGATRCPTFPTASPPRERATRGRKAHPRSSRSACRDGRAPHGS